MGAAYKINQYKRLSKPGSLENTNLNDLRHAKELEGKHVMSVSPQDQQGRTHTYFHHCYA